MTTRILSINANSILRGGRRTLLRDLINKENADIIMVQETGLDTGTRMTIHEYNIFRCDFKRNWGGVMLLVRKNIPVRNVRCRRKPIQEIAAEALVGDKWMRFTSIYIPHGITGNIPRTFQNFFTAHCTDAVYGGDTNARHHSFGDHTENAYGHALSTVANKINMILLHPSEPTCMQSEHGSRIDKFIVSPTVGVPP